MFCSRHLRRTIFYGGSRISHYLERRATIDFKIDTDSTAWMVKRQLPFSYVMYSVTKSIQLGVSQENSCYNHGRFYLLPLNGLLLA